MTENRYGFFGWKEFESNRSEILREYDRSKEVNQSRPVQSEHGIAGEAAIRRWLETFLPAKFGVTSGYIIPDLVVTEHYKLYHFDVIVFDKTNAPILWADGNGDQSEQGKKRAIPSKYVKAVFEIKAKLTEVSIRDAVEKLSQLNSIAQYLPKDYFSNIIFIELDIALKNASILKKLLPAPQTHGFSGGLILRSALNLNMSGKITLLSPEGGAQQTDLLVPLAKDINSLNIHLNNEGQPVIGEQGAGLMLFPYNGQLHFSKNYGPIVWNGDTGISLSWSNNSFARFTLDTLSYLEGLKPSENVSYFFGQVFDVISPAAVIA